MHYWSEHGLFGGHPFLDFVNTIDDEGKTRSVNGIPDWATALRWGVAAGVVSAKEARRLARLSQEPTAAGEFDRLMALRETAWRELSRLAADRPAGKKSLDALSHSIRWALDHAVLAPRDGAFHWSPDAAKLGLRLFRARLALALLDLTGEPDMAHLRECGRCTGLFLDRGRGRGRRWCRMTTCGNRAKIERFRSKR